MTTNPTDSLHHAPTADIQIPGLTGEPCADSHTEYDPAALLSLVGGGIILDGSLRTITAPTGEQSVISPKVFGVLHYLGVKKPEIQSRDKILKNVWGDTYVNDRTVDVHTRWVRELLAELELENLIRVLTERGKGYGVVDLNDPSFESARHSGARA